MSKHNPLIRRTIGMLAAAALISGTMSALHGALPRSQARLYWPRRRPRRPPLPSPEKRTLRPTEQPSAAAASLR